MLDSDYPGQVCSIARSLEVVGERWTLLILRDVFLGIHRFDDLVESLGVTRTVLARRLRKLVDEEVLERRPTDRPDRVEYHLTEKGQALVPVLATLMRWGDRYYTGPDGPPRLMLHRGCGGELTPRFTCSRCEKALGPNDIDAPLTAAGGA
jgi:DNA-binding HxlR family transcriptional regulator